VALTYAAWAGYHSAHGHHVDAGDCARMAKAANGKVITSGSYFGARKGELRVIAVGGDPSKEDVDFLIDTLSIYRDGLERKAAAEAKPPTPVAPDVTPSPEP
jgi:hypothetical protein